MTTTDTTKKPNFSVLLWIIGIIIACLGIFIFINEYTLQTWEEVFLETRPVDPRDILRWDFVILSYQLEEEEKMKTFLQQNTFTQWDTFYVILDKNTEWGVKIQSISQTKPTDSEIFIRAKIGTRWDIDFGIGKYFVPEGTGRNIERVRGDMEVLVRIDKYGTAKIVDLYYQWEKIVPKDFSY